TTPQKFTRMVYSQSAGVASTRWPKTAMPALLHTRCTAPKRATAASASARTWAASPTSVRTVSTSAPAPRTVAAERSRASGSMSASTSRAPRAAKAAAIAAPMPLPPPVTTATRSLKGSAMTPHTADARSESSTSRRGSTRRAAGCYVDGMTEAPVATGRRPIVPFLRLPEEGEPFLVRTPCTACGAVYLGDRIACSRCAACGPFEEVPLSRNGTLWVYSIVHQSFPGVPVPYVVGVVDLPEGVAVRCNIIDVEPKPEAI